MRTIFRLSSFSFLFVMFLAACTSTKHIAYFQNIGDSVFMTREPIDSIPVSPAIEPDDILLIQVSSPNAGAAAMFNQSSLGSSTTSGEYIGATSTPQSLYGRAADRTLGYLVDSAGNINFPVLGRLHLAGLSLVHAQDTIQNRLLKYLDNPLVNIRFLNYKITILGEVAHPGTYTIPNQQVNLLQALGLAGDMTIFGKRTNVLVIREKHGVRSYGRINLNNSESLFHSPYYHLQQNDVVYVEPRKSKVWNSDQAALRNVSIVVAILSTLSIIATRF